MTQAVEECNTGDSRKRPYGPPHGSLRGKWAHGYPPPNVAIRTCPLALVNRISNTTDCAVCRTSQCTSVSLTITSPRAACQKQSWSSTPLICHGAHYSRHRTATTTSEPGNGIPHATVYIQSLSARRYFQGTSDQISKCGQF